jgi:hypothetical protein
MTRRIPPLPGTVLGVFVAALMLAACGGGATSSGGVASIAGATTTRTTTTATSNSSASRQAALMKAAQCMRTNGVTSFPDPTIDANGGVRLAGLRGLDRNNPIVAKALRACQADFFAARPTFTPAQQIAIENGVLALAKCVRAHGYPMPDPNFGPSGGPFFGEGGVNRNDPRFLKAFQACRPVLVRILAALPPGIVG